MQSYANQLAGIADEYLPRLQSLSEDVCNYRPSPTRWSKKEILGHLIDSAQNNIRRVIVAQYEERPKIVYDQDKWVAATNYQEYNLERLVTLWYLLNKHLSHVLKFVPKDMAGRQCESEALHSIDWLAGDYIRHLLHHLHQVLELEPLTYP